NSSHVQRAVLPATLVSVRSHLSSGLRGVGPAERTGKSRVSYWPGGRREALSLDGRRPRKPRETGDMNSFSSGFLHHHTTTCAKTLCVWQFPSLKEARGTEHSDSPDARPRPTRRGSGE